MNSQPDNGGRSDAAAEAYRRLRSTVKFAVGDRPIRSVLVVDVDRSEPSAVARELAEAFARAGDTCVYVDANVRRSNPSESEGITDLVACRVSVDEAIKVGEAGHCAVVEPGTLADPDLLAGPGFPKALEKLQQHYGYVILSSAPLPEYGDAIALGPQVDAVVLAVTSGDTRRPRAIAARDSLARVGARLLGLVMIEPSGRRLR